jgi:hypothetical protein
MGASWPFPGAILLPRNVLERRCDPASRWRHPAITGRDQHLILISQEGLQSSLATAPWQRPGLAHATDLDGGFRRRGRRRTPGDAGRSSKRSQQQPALATAPSHG